MSAGHGLGVSSVAFESSDPGKNVDLTDATGLSGTECASTSVEPQAGVNQCPFTRNARTRHAVPLERPSHTENSANLAFDDDKPAASDATCRHDEGAGSSPNSGPPSLHSNVPSQPTEKRPPQCPLGFGSDNRAKLDPMNCILCKALYFDAVRTQCGHVFCRVCAEKGDLCIICGATACPLQSDSDMQDTIDTYIEVHSRSHKLLADGQVVPQDQVQSPHAAKAAFFLQIGLRSLAGANLPAGADRLRSCYESLLAQVQEEKATPSTKLALQIGAVCGSQGDCAVRQHDSEGGRAKYLESMTFLKAAEQTLEVVHATSVTLSKMGDLQYMQQDLSGARALYEECLDLRRHHDHTDAEKLDLAAAHVKVGDIADALKDADAPKRHFDEAKVLLASFEDEGPESDIQHDLSPADSRKRHSLQSFLASH